MPCLINQSDCKNDNQHIISLHKFLLDIKDYEYVTIQQIAEWNSIPVTGFQEAIYTNTFVCQNFPDLSEKSLLQHKFSLFKSKVDVNSLRRLYVFPEKSLSIHLKYDVNTFDVIEMEYLLAEMVKDIKRSIKKLSP